MTTIHLEWAPNPASQLVTSYQVFQTRDGGSPSPVGDPTSTTYLDIVNPVPGVYTFAVKASNFVGSSPLGAAATGPGLPTAPDAPTLSVSVS